MKGFTDEAWQDARKGALLMLRPGAMLVNLAATRARGSTGPIVGMLGIRANKGDPDYPLAPETGAHILDRVAADPDLPERIAMFRQLGFTFEIQGDGEAWWEGVYLAVRPGPGSEAALRDRIKGGLDAVAAADWDRRFDAWIAQNYGSGQLDGRASRPEGLD